VEKGARAPGASEAQAAALAAAAVDLERRAAEGEAAAARAEARATAGEAAAATAEAGPLPALAASPCFLYNRLYCSVPISLFGIAVTFH